MSEKSMVMGDPGTAQPIGLGVVAQRPNFVDGDEQGWDGLREALAGLKESIELRPVPMAPAKRSRGWAGWQSGDSSMILLERIFGGWLILLWKGHSTWITGLTNDELERLITEGPDPELMASVATEDEARAKQGFEFGPCPFCRRNTARGKSRMIKGTLCHWVECEHCGAIGPASRDERAALEQWNCAYRPKLSMLNLMASVAVKGEGDGQDH